MNRYICDSQNRKGCVIDDSDETSKACWLFGKPITIDDQTYSNQFSNIFCAVCSHHNDMMNMTIKSICPLPKNRTHDFTGRLHIAYDGAEADNPAFKISVTFTGTTSLSYDNQVVCQDGTYWDDQKKFCRALVCESDHWRI